MDGASGLNDKGTAADNIKPAALGGSGGGETPFGLNKKAPGIGGGSAKEDLANAEKAAESSGDGEIGGGVDGVRQSEEEAGGLYTGVGRKIKPKVKPTGFKGVVKKGGPIYAILFTIFLGGGLLTGAQLFQPFSLLAQFQETFNSMHVSANKRSERFFKAQMSTRTTKSPFSVFGTKFSLGKNQITELGKQGIEFDDTTFKGSDGKPIKVLKYKDGSGEIKIVAATETEAKRLTELDLSKFNTEGVKYNTEAVDFKKLYSSDTGFFTKYNAGSLTWRGQIANWFGTNTSNFLKNNKLTRNMFAKYKEKKAEANGDGMKVVRDIIDERTGEVKGVEARSKSADTEEDENGHRILSTDDDGDPRIWTESADVEPASRKNINVKEKLQKISGGFTSAANVGCAVVGMIGAVSLLVSASEALQIINVATAYFETIDKTKAGYGEDAPINEMVGAFNERKENDYMVIEPTGESFNGESSFMGANGDGGISTLASVPKTTNGSAMESAGVVALYSGGVVDPNDTSVQSFNFANSAKRILGGIGVSMAAYESCTLAKSAAAWASVGMDSVSLIACIVSGGTACAPFVIEKIVQVVASAGIAVVLGGIIAVITPTVSGMLTRDVMANMGEDLGNGVTSAANKYLGGTHRANGGSLASIEKYDEYAVQQQQVIAENAKYERESLSPFDLTSKYTFLGSIMTQMMKYTSVNSLMGIFTSSKNAVSSSLIALSPTAMAYDIEESLPTMEEYAEVCPYMASIGAIGDSFCNPYVITDVSTIEDDPDDVVNAVYSYGGLEDEESNGNVVIKDDSDLAKYIRYCDNRSSDFGIADQNIANELTEKTTFDTGSAVVDNLGNGAIGSAPILGDAIELLEDDKIRDNIGYVSGESCVAGNTVSTSESPNWEKAQYYQRFIEDQSLAESMGVVEKSAVTAYLEKYYEENPLDNSYEGILARYSGMDKEQVVALLDVIDYYNYIAQYDPSTRYAFGEPSIEVERKIVFDNENVLSGEVVLLGRFVYADVRNRSYAV